MCAARPLRRAIAAGADAPPRLRRIVDAELEQPRRIVAAELEQPPRRPFGIVGDVAQAQRPPGIVAGGARAQRRRVVGVVLERRPPGIVAAVDVRP